MIRQRDIAQWNIASSSRDVRRTLKSRASAGAGAAALFKRGAGPGSAVGSEADPLGVESDSLRAKAAGFDSGVCIGSFVWWVELRWHRLWRRHRSWVSAGDGELHRCARLDAGARRTKRDALRVRPDAQDARGLVALAKEQLALVADDRSHWFSFGWGLKYRKRV